MVIAAQWFICQNTGSVCVRVCVWETFVVLANIYSSCLEEVLGVQARVL